ncbi:hypothetical protein AC1031_016886 [Aphanomyces cochlioides]|nr:hypothetical protein AC1031_016886 [Aphanomyces cochlioides]
MSEFRERHEQSILDVKLLHAMMVTKGTLSKSGSDGSNSSSVRNAILPSVLYPRLSSDRPNSTKSGLRTLIQWMTSPSLYTKTWMVSRLLSINAHANFVGTSTQWCGNGRRRFTLDLIHIERCDAWHGPIPKYTLKRPEQK